MISAQSAQQAIQDYRNSVSQQLQEHADPDTLIVCIGHPDSGGYYFPPVDSVNSLVLKLAGDTLSDAWDALELAFRSTNIRSLFICSHSRAYDRAEFGARPAQRLGFVRGVIESQERMKRSKKQFVESVSWLKNQLAESHQIPHSELTIAGFFYLVESGIFLIPDSETGEFHPLTKHGLR